MRITSLRNVLGSLFISLLVAVPAVADLYNFGADIGGETIYADSSDYSAPAGMGWTFKTDPGASSSPDLLFQDKRATYPALDQALATDVLDIREAAVVATDKDYFTWRIDLPNGQYEVTAMAGLASAAARADIVIGDVFNSSGNTGAIDRNSDTQLMLSGVIPGGTSATSDTLTYDVENGYMLVGVRRSVGFSHFGVMNTIDIVAVPEPATMMLSVVGGFAYLLRRRKNGISV